MTFFESFLIRPFTVLYHTFSYIARQKMRKKINGVFTKKAHSVYAKITKRNSNRRRKKYFKTQKSSQNDVVRLYFTFFSHIPLALSVKKCYTYKKIIYNILYNRIVLFWRHSSSADGLCRKANTAEPRKIRPCGFICLLFEGLALGVVAVARSDALDVYSVRFANAPDVEYTSVGGAVNMTVRAGA